MLLFIMLLCISMSVLSMEKDSLPKSKFLLKKWSKYKKKPQKFSLKTSGRQEDGRDVMGNAIYQRVILRLMALNWDEIMSEADTSPDVKGYLKDAARDKTLFDKFFSSYLAQDHIILNSDLLGNWELITSLQILEGVFNQFVIDEIGILQKEMESFLSNHMSNREVFMENLKENIKKKST